MVNRISDARSVFVIELRGLQNGGISLKWCIYIYIWIVYRYNITHRSRTRQGLYRPSSGCLGLWWTESLMLDLFFFIELRGLQNGGISLKWCIYMYIWILYRYNITHRSRTRQGLYRPSLGCLGLWWTESLMLDLFLLLSYGV